MKKFGFVNEWIPIGVVVSLLSLMIFGVAQQTIRLSAYNPQTQMAEDAALKIANGMPPSQVISADNIDMAQSLSPFMIVYDDRGTVLASSVVLDGVTPNIPAGVLSAARERTDNVTWEPKPGVRAAAVIVRYVGGNPGFVLAARSLRETEKLTQRIFFDVIVGWVFTMAASLFACFCFRIHR